MKHSVIFISLVLSLTGCVQHSKDKVLDARFVTDSKKTLKHLNEIEKREGNSADLWYKRAEVYFKLARYDKALQDINAAIVKDKSKQQYYLLRGLVQDKKNNPEKAVESMMIAERMGSRNHKLYEVLASQYLKTNEADKAREAVERLVKLQPGAISYALKADILLAVKDTSEAIQNYKRALRYDTQRSSYEKLSTIYLGQNQIDSAARYINEFLTSSPADKEFLTKKGQLLTQLSLYDSAKSLYSRLVQLDSSSYMAYYKLSDVYYTLTDFDSARLMAQKALSLNESSFEAQMIVAQSFDKQRQYQEAMRVYETILEQDSTHNLALNALDELKRKVAYLWRLEQQRQAQDSARKNAPPTLQKKSIDN